MKNKHDTKELWKELKERAVREEKYKDDFHGLYNEYLKAGSLPSIDPRSIATCGVCGNISVIEELDIKEDDDFCPYCPQCGDNIILLGQVDPYLVDIIRYGLEHSPRAKDLSRPNTTDELGDYLWDEDEE